MNPRKWPVRGPVVLGMVALVLLVGGFGAWSVLSRIAGAVIASGQIEVEHHRQVVQHPDGGVVAAILVTEGAHVAAGDPLIRLDGALLRSEFAIVESQFHEILSRRGRLEAERDESNEIVFPPLLRAATALPEVQDLMEGQQRLFDARRETLDRQLEQFAKRSGQIRSQIDGLDAQLDALATQLGLIQGELVSQQSLLDRGLTQSARVLALQRDEAGLRGSLGELTAARAEAEARITEIEIEALRLRSQRREDALTQLRDLGFRELELAERRRALQERLELLELRAPVAGIVHGLQVTTPRAVIRAAEPVMFLVPQDRPLVVSVRVAPLEIDQVFVGQEAHLVFPTFSARTTPDILGRVVLVSSDAFTDERSQASFYRVEIAPLPGELEKLEGLTLLPGMPVEAFIQTEARTPLAYLVKPLTDYFDRAFRES
ncbi:HlyD family type I secretion periplasmic adaptor subunit [Plastorhodobacter daqingensis]|uniref:Membrane fusion protein (MFP) family protein n=1 Tax=Plastorhodobacter daqingensis TaxID=1387281 RepID=A0ABW2UDW9_9RHOB